MAAPVKPPGGGPADRAVGQGDVAAGQDLVKLHPEIGQALPDLAHRLYWASCQSTNPWVNPTQFSR